MKFNEFINAWIRFKEVTIKFNGTGVKRQLNFLLDLMSEKQLLIEKKM